MAESVTLTPDEQHRLDLLSDLSGYPDGREFTPYLSGYPNGRFYVLARTVPDLAAERDGTVWTHSLLLPLSEAVELPSLAAAVGAAHRERTPPPPTAIRHPRELVGSGEDPPLEGGALRQLVAAWFGEVRRPVVWLDPATAVAAVLQLWRRLPNEHRASLAFCTNALQGRWIDGRPFDWLGVEPRRVRHLGELSARATFAGEGKTSPAGESLPKDLDALADPAFAEDCWRRATGRGMAPSRVPVSVLVRYELLRQDGFGGRAACLDLARRHGASAEEIDALFSEMLEASPASSARERLTRALQVIVRLPEEQAPESRARVAHWLAPILSDPEGLTDPELLERLLADSPRWSTEVGTWLAEACATAPPAHVARFVARNDGLLPVIFARLTTEQRRAVVQAWPTGAERPVHRLVAQAELLGDLALLLELPADGAALAAAARISERDPDSATAAALLNRVESDELLAWLSDGPERLRGPMARPIVARLKGEASFVDWLLTANLPDAERLEHLSRNATRGSLRHGTAGPVWRLAQAHPATDRALVEHILELVGDQILQWTFEQDAAWKSARWAPDARQYLAEPLIRAVLDGESGWATAPVFATVLAEERECVMGVLERTKGSATVALLAHPPGDSLLPSKRTFKLLRSLVTEAPWKRRNQWISILDRLETERREELAILLYWSVLESPDAEAGIFAAWLLRILHPVSHEERPRGLLRRALKRAKEFFDLADVEEWDTQRQLRAALVQAWARYRWPQQVLRDACPDEKAWEWMLDEVRRQPDAPELGRRLGEQGVRLGKVRHRP